MTDMRRMQGVLTEEQSRQIAEQKRNEDKIAEEKSKSSLLTVKNSSTPFSKSTSEPGSCVDCQPLPKFIILFSTDHLRPLADQ